MEVNVKKSKDMCESDKYKLNYLTEVRIIYIHPLKATLSTGYSLYMLLPLQTILVYTEKLYIWFKVCLTFSIIFILNNFWRIFAVSYQVESGNMRNVRTHLSNYF